MPAGRGPGHGNPSEKDDYNLKPYKLAREKKKKKKSVKRDNQRGIIHRSSGHFGGGRGRASADLAEVVVLEYRQEKEGLNPRKFECVVGQGHYTICG